MNNLQEVSESPVAMRIAKLVSWMVLGCIFLMSSCTVLTSIDDAAVVEAEGVSLKAQYDGKAAEALAKVEVQKKRLETLEVLSDKYGPVGARCAIMGWNNTSEGACTMAEAVNAAKK